MPATTETTNDPIEDAAKLLRAAGWTCLPPVNEHEKLPDPAPGQVWVSPKRGVEPRTIVKIGPHRAWPGQQVVFFTTPTRQPGEWGYPGLIISSWLSWARKSLARPNPTS